MNRGWVVDIVEHLPQALVSRGWGWLARRKAPKPAVRLLKRVFVRLAGIDLSEAGATVDDYACLEDLFVRKLLPGQRVVDADPRVVVSPVDGAVGACGTVTDGTLLQLKGRTYSLARLLGDSALAEGFEGGDYATIYLAPHNYHRIHSPVGGEVREATVIPGALMPVFHESLERVEELFARNERLISYVSMPNGGRVAVVKVGATLVGRISLAFDDSVHTNDGGQSMRALQYDPPIPMEKGGELGAFELGSTVVLVFDKGAAKLDELTPGAVIRMGERIGMLEGDS